MMSLAHLHLLLNHLPILGLPIATLFLVHSYWRGNRQSQTFALLAVTLLCLAVIPVYLTGEPAEDVAEKLPGVTESFIHNHEESGEVSLVLTLSAGVCAALTLFVRQVRENPWAPRIVVSLCIFASASLGYTGFLGGQVRHTEIRS